MQIESICFVFSFLQIVMSENGHRRRYVKRQYPLTCGQEDFVLVELLRDLLRGQVREQRGLGARSDLEHLRRGTDLSDLDP